MCQIWDNDRELDPGRPMTEVQFYIHEQDPKWDESPWLAQFIAARAKTPAYLQYTASLGRPDGKFYIETNGLFVRQAVIHGAIQTVGAKLF